MQLPCECVWHGILALSSNVFFSSQKLTNTSELKEAHSAGYFTSLIFFDHAKHLRN